MTNMTVEGQRIVKADALGRLKTPPEQRDKILDEFERSGLSGVKFAALVGVKYQTLASWALRRRRSRIISKSPSKPIDQVRWLEAVVTEAQQGTPAASSSIKLHLPGGVWLELSEANQVELAVRVVRALQKPTAPC
jgi:hypothetical protein